MSKVSEILESLNEFQIPVDTFDVSEIPANILSTLEDVAKEFLNIDTLKTQNSDEKDFHDVSVWSLAMALYQAYSLGQASMEE